MKSLLILLIFNWVISCFAQEMISEKSKNILDKKYVFYINPVHLTNSNYTFSLEKFLSGRKSMKVMLSGSEVQNYVAAGADLNYYPFEKNALNYFAGMSLLLHESPVEAGVSLNQPFNKFYEGDEDQYSGSLQVVNGVLLNLSRYVIFETDLRIGPAVNFKSSASCWLWSININLGIPFE